MVALILLLLSSTYLASAQMVRQCTCAEVEPCKNQAANTILQCADQCQKHVTAMGASYPQMRQCIMAKEPIIQAVIGCEQRQLNGACARGPGGTVPKRYPETLKIAAMSEINHMLSRSGIQAEARGILSVGKRFASCIMKCMDRGSGRCMKKLKCGLALPSDTVLVQSTKQCAIQSGFNTAGVRQLCSCVAATGVRGLAPLCNRIIIS